MCVCGYAKQLENWTKVQETSLKEEGRKKKGREGGKKNVKKMREKKHNSLLTKY